MNETMKLLKSHRSIRKFTSQPIEQYELRTIIEAAQAASTSSNVQAYSVVRVSDPGKRTELARLAGNQAYVADCPEFLVWCADLHRNRQVSGRDNETAWYDSAENLLIATIDAALAAQNAAVAAESLALGVVYIGGLRNNIGQVSALLELPELVYPVFGMCIGHPDQQPEVKPRLPLEAVLHQDRYDSERAAAHIAGYNAVSSDYMLRRTGGASARSWSEDMHGKYAGPQRVHMKDFLSKQGFNKR